MSRVRRSTPPSRRLLIFEKKCEQRLPDDNFLLPYQNFILNPFSALLHCIIAFTLFTENFILPTAVPSQKLSTLT